MMAHRGMGGVGQPQRMIGDYIVTTQIGAGSFAVVWKARHKLSGHEVAIKEIATEKLNPKLQESLLSEIAILKRTTHPNIIRLHDIVEAPNRIFLVLEYCTGGDLAAYIQRHGRVTEAVARHFMRQLGAGLQVLRANNLIHRDLKPQNLLLSTNDRHAVLKIADFGFARSLQPQGMAETICGSPLYMAPEILQRQKYDAKADLWSVGAILFQLLTGRPPYCGNSHVQLLLNIVRSNEVKFPEIVLSELHPDCVDMIRKLLRRNPVERLSFEEFFNHNFMDSVKPKGEKRSPGHSTRKAAELTDHSSQDEYFPFSLDDDVHNSPRAAPRSPPGSRKPTLYSTSPPNSLLQAQQGGGAPAKFSVGTAPPAPPNRATGSRQSRIGSGFVYEEKMKITGFGTSPTSRGLQRSQNNKQSGFSSAEDRIQLKDMLNPSSAITSSKGGAMMDSMEYIEREYVLVGNMVPSTESLSMSATFVGKVVGSPPQKSASSAPTSATLTTGTQAMVMLSGGHVGSPSHDIFQAASETGQHGLEGPSSDPQTRLFSLKRCARLITELASDKLEAGQVLDSFAVQLVCLAIWKESMHACHTWAAAAAEQNGQPYPRGGAEADHEASAATACSIVEREFSVAVDRAEDLACHVRALDGGTEMQDAMDLIYQAALAVGRAGAVEELMGNVSNAAVAYAKAAAFFYFLLVEAPYLPLNPPLVLSSVDRQRLRRYADAVTIRQHQCTALREAIQEQQQSF